MGHEQTKLHRQHIAFAKTHYLPFKNLKHTARQVELSADHTTAKVHLGVETKTVEAVADISRYYLTRAKLAKNRNLVGLMQMEVIDGRGNNITQYLNQHGTVPQSSRNGQFDTVCSLNIFETHCRRNQNEKNPIKGELRLYHEFFAWNLEKESESRRKAQEIYSEKQLWNIMGGCVQAANILGGLGLKQPLLSPLAIKLTPEGEVKVGEWEFTHYFEDAQAENDFHQQGETFLYHTEDTISNTDLNQKQQFDILSCYYWPPEGTTSIQSSMGLGKLPGSKQNRGQVFSLGMTLLQLILERPLYQKQTFSDKQLTRYLQEAASYRLRQGYPMSHLMVSLLSKMLTWESKQRISFQQLQQEMRNSQSSSTYLVSSERESLGKESASNEFRASLGRECASNGFRTVQKRGQLNKDVQGSGLIDQGSGDQTHPTAETIDKNYFSTRSRAENSLDYLKLDYTIHRQRKEWQKFQNRFTQSYKLQPQELTKHSHSFPAEIMLEDSEDLPSQQSLVQVQLTSREMQVFDEEQERPVDYSNCISDSIKILDLSNIRATEQDTLKDNWLPLKEMAHHTPCYAKTVQLKKNTPKQLIEQDSLLLKSSKSPQIAKLNHQHITNSANSLRITHSVSSLHNESAAHGKTHSDDDLFTSPELMALIKSSARRQSQKENSYHNIKLELSPSCVTSKVPVEMSQSSFVKEQFAKGWYQGGKLDGLRSGYGTFHYNQGGKYCGDWKQNLMHGRGTLYYSDGRIAYQGEWNCDRLHGNGILYNQNPSKLCSSFDYRNFEEAQDIWIYYEGGFANDDKCGRGVLQLSNGQRFEGTFRNDVIEGKGIFYPLDGTMVEGQWSNNRLIRIQSVFDAKS